MNENLIKLEKWYDGIKNIPQLKLKEAKEISESLLINPDEYKRENLITGTLYVIYNFIKKSGLLVINNSSYNMDDIISVCCESWIELIDNNKLLTVTSFTGLESYFYNNIKNQLVTYEKNDNLTNFEDILNWYVEQKNKGFEISYNDFIDYILVEFDILPKPNNKYVNLYNTISQIYEICCKDENLELNLNKKQLNNLKCLLIDCTVNKSYFEEKNSIDENDFTEKLEKNVINDLIREFIFKKSCLNDRELKILYKRYGLDGGEPQTFEQIGKALKLRAERIRQIELVSFRKLRYPIHKKLREYINN